MKGHVWAVEELIRGWMLIDAYLLLRSLGYDQEYFVVIGMTGKHTIRELATAHQIATKRINDTDMKICFKGGPRWTDVPPKHFVTSIAGYVADRVLRSILTEGHTKVSRIIDEISRDREKYGAMS